MLGLSLSMTSISGALARVPPVVVADLTTGELPAWITASGGVEGSRFNSSGANVAATSPRFDYSLGTLAARGLLIEAAAQNVYKNSENAAAWGLTGASASVLENNLFSSRALATITATVNSTAPAALSLGVSATTGDSWTATIALVAGNQTSARFGMWSSGAGYGANGDSVARILNASGAAVSQVTGSLFLITGLSSTPTIISISRANWASSGALYSVLQIKDGATCVIGDTIKVGMPSITKTAAFTTYVSTGASAVTRTAESVTIGGGYSNNPAIIETTSLATGATTRTAYAAGAIPSPLPSGIWLRGVAIYPIGTSIETLNSRLAAGSAW